MYNSPKRTFAMGQPLLNKILELDDILGQFNLYDRYHASSGIILVLGMIFNAIWYTNFIFVAEKVGYICVDNWLETEDLSSSLNISSAQHSITTELWCKNPNSCSEWVYDSPDSFVAEFQLACQDWKRTSVGSVHGFGYMVGLLIVGPLSDRFGRKPLVIITGVAAGVLGLAKSFATWYWLYIALEFLEGAIGDPISPLFTLASEMVATKARVTYTTMCNAGLVGGTLLALMAWLIPYWRTLVRVLYSPGLLFIVLIYLLDESPRWLLSKGKKEKAVEIIRKAAKQNKMTIEENLDMISYEMDERTSFVSAIKDTFISRPLMKRFAVCVIWWVASIFTIHGILINSVSLPGNKYVIFALSAAMKLPSSFLSSYIVTKLNRRRSLLLFFLVCAVLCIGAPFVPKNLLWLLVITYMVDMMASCMCTNVIYIYTPELFPTHTRNSMQALCSSVGRIGSIMATQTPLLVAYWSGLPTTMFGAVSLTAGLATFLVPDTGERNLPDTVRQAEALQTPKN